MNLVKVVKRHSAKLSLRDLFRPAHTSSTTRVALSLAGWLVLAPTLAARSSSARPGSNHPTKIAEPPAGYVALSSAPPQRTVLRLPVEGIWGVLQGANSPGTHQGYAAFAYDLVPAEKPVTEVVFRRRSKLTEHPCYGRPVLAPADGRVVWARDGARELPPFKEGKRHEAGNFVILEHAPDELTEFRHLQKGSVTVREGDVVRAGQPIGRCGNSGNALTPHLHFALLGSYKPIATRPMLLSDYEVMDAKGAWSPGNGELQPGQIIRATPVR
jgi:hypothetical protein